MVTSTEKQIFSSQYKTPFFFSSKALENFKIEIIELKKVYRQKDEEFISLLNRIRNNSVSEEDLKILNSRHRPSFKPKKNEFYIHLTAINKTADSINEEHIKALKGKAHQSSALIEGNFGKEYFPTHPELKFKIGSQVMLINNDSKRRWVNGSIGVITGFNTAEEYMTVQLYPENKEVFVPLYTWDIYRFFFSKEKKAIVSEVAGSFSQYPIRLAWAITIHKSQGKTFDRAVIDMSRGMFASGQAYVALSRCRSFEGLVLKNPIKKYHIKTDYRIFNFLTAHRYQKAEKDMPVKEKIKRIKEAIDNKKLLQISYLKANDEQSHRKVRPLEAGLQTYRNKQFQGMRAFCFKAGEERMFRIDRILKLERV
ncbi:MAG: WYL domain-containing protein [Oligoflexia bacterium]|nr:WYL domain-containing protein [Oligoflexia bacterium]